jgi:hypothetical protein
MYRRGTSRSPGSDPRRLATGLDLRAISIVEGVRAGLAAAVPVMASVWFEEPILALAALGALLTCICDPAGPMRRRLPLLLSFVIAGGCMLGGFGLLRAIGLGATMAVAAPILFACAFLRIWGQPTQALGNLLAVVLVLGTDEPLRLREAVMVGGVFAAGGLWALLLTLAIWRIHPYGPARRAVADVWAELAVLTRMVAGLCEADAPAENWDGQARGGRGGVRAAIERARGILMETVDARGPSSGPAAQNLLRLESADQVFAVLIALSDALEQSDTAIRDRAVPLLRRLRALLVVLAGATEREHLSRAPRFERTLTALVDDVAADTALGPLSRLLAERMRVATKFIDPAQYLPGSGPQGEAGMPFRQRLAGPLFSNLTWSSASLRHAVRITVVVTPALTGTLLWHGAYTHWLTITLVLVMQPFFALTWQRSLERVGGTLLGAVFAGLLSTLFTSRLHVAGGLPVLGALALAVRQVSYGVYIAVYTPTVIFLVESIRPGHSQLDVALSRAGFTLAGGLIAVVANWVLWPSWEPDRVRQDLTLALRAHAAFARTVLLPGADADFGRARRAAGLASNNLEASLARAMQEPRRSHRDRLQAVLVADATLRRVAGRLIAISLNTSLATPQATPASTPASAPPFIALGTPRGDVYRGPIGVWVVAALEALAAGEPVPARPAETGGDAMDRLARQVSLLPDVMTRMDAGGPAALPGPATRMAAGGVTA